MKNPHFLPLLLIAAVAAMGTPATAAARHLPDPTGIWYLALDAEPYGLPDGTVLPGLVMINRGGTALLADGGDFGGFPFMGRDSNQFATWRWTHGGIAMVSLFLQADAISGDVQAWYRVHLDLHWKDVRTLTGTVNVYRLGCVGMAPVGVFNCPDPIGEASAFEADPPPDVDVTLRRLPKYGALDR